MALVTARPEAAHGLRNEVCYRADVETTAKNIMIERLQYRGKEGWLEVVECGSMADLRGLRPALLAALLCVALGAPAPVFASQSVISGGARAASSAPAAAPDSAAPLPEMGVRQVPDHGRTELPAAPITPRPHYARPPAHLP